MLSECLGDSSMHIGVPFIAPRQLGAVRGQLGRPNLPSVGWWTGHWSLGSVGAPDTVRCTPDSLVCPTDRCCGPRVARGLRGRPLALATIGAGDRWLTGPSGAPPDSSVNYSRTPPSEPESGLFTGDQPGAPDSTVQCARPNLNFAAHSQAFPFASLLL
jgi:hypothetical protein